MEKSGKITLDVPSLLNSLGKSLYKSSTVTLRELLQNAHDGIALFLRQYPENDIPDNFSPEIRIRLYRGKNQLIVSDNGIGMSGEDLEREFATVGRSRKADLHEIISGRNLGRRVIGQYGIGFLASFLVAERVDVYSKTQDAPAAHWWCDGSDKYFLEFCDVEFERGTKVVLTLKQDIPKEYQSVSGIKELTIKYGSLLPFPIYVQGARVNRFSEGWASRRAFSEMSEATLTEFLREKFPVEFLDVFRINQTAEHIRYGDISFRAALFISRTGIEAFYFRGTPLEKVATGIDVYCKGMFVCRMQDMMPIWARFVHGVIDFDNLDLSLSREEVVQNELFKTYQSILESKIIHRLHELNGTEKLRTIVARHRPDLIRGVVILGEKKIGREGITLLDSLIDVLPFETTHGTMTIPQYRRAILDASHKFRMCKADTLYTMPQHTTGAGESLLAEDMGWPVILTVSEEQKILNDYANQHEKITLKSLSPDDLVEAARQGEETENDEVIGAMFRQHLSRLISKNIEIRVAHFRESIPSLLLVESGNEEGQKFLKMLEEAANDPELKNDQMFNLLMRLAQQYQVERGLSFFYVNARNPLIRNMVKLYRRNPVDDTLALATRTVYNSALLQSAHRSLSPRDAEIIIENFNETLGTVLALTLERNQEEMDPEQQPRYASFVFCAHSFTAPSVLAAMDRAKIMVKQLLRIDALSADEDIRDLKVTENIRKMIRECKFGIADITGNNPNVMMEIGMLEMLGKPVVKIRDVADDANIPIDIGGDLYCTYNAAHTKDGKWDVGAGFVDDLQRFLLRANEMAEGR